MLIESQKNNNYVMFLNVSTMLLFWLSFLDFRKAQYRLNFWGYGSTAKVVNRYLKGPEFEPSRVSIVDICWFKST